MSGIVNSKQLPGVGNIKTTHHELSDGTMVMEHTSDVTGILEANKFQQSEQTMHHQSETFNHVARIDMLAVESWCKARGMGNGYWAEFMESEALLKEFLNDPDNKVWRTRTGKI